MDYDDEIIKDPIGFFSIKNMPTSEELSKFYNEQYFQNDKSRPKEYQEQYDENEIKHKNLINDLCFFSIYKLRPNWRKKEIKLLEVGVGEGFLLSYAEQKGLNVEGIDFNDYAVKKFNPHVANKVRIGNPLDILDDFRSQSKKFDVCILRNVLEHVIDPRELLKTLKDLLSNNGILIITIPNDFSDLQLRAYELGYVKEKFWVTHPDHLHYFNTENIENFVNEMHFKMLDRYSTFPIDFFLFHPDSNYIQDENQGKPTHRARIELDLILAKKGISNYSHLSQSFASCGVGRDLTVILENLDN